jgi:hypothetical protein
MDTPIRKAAIEGNTRRYVRPRRTNGFGCSKSPAACSESISITLTEFSCKIQTLQSSTKNSAYFPKWQPNSVGWRVSDKPYRGQRQPSTNTHAGHALTENASVAGRALRHADSTSSRSSFTRTFVEAASQTASA